jgi:hypothetical protein
MSGIFREFRGEGPFYARGMEEAVKLLRGEADLCRWLAATIDDREVIAELLATADEAEDRIARLSAYTSAELTVH